MEKNAVMILQKEATRTNPLSFRMVFLKYVKYSRNVYNVFLQARRDEFRILI